MAPARTVKSPTTGIEARLQARDLIWDRPTSGIAKGYLQANLIVLPSQYARDFELLCARNPVPCPLLAKSAVPGDYSNFVSYVPGIPNSKIASEIDVRTDAARYTIYQDGTLLEEGAASLEELWNEDDHVAFLIGCSYSFESALTRAGLTPPHVSHGRNVSMYRTNVPLNSAGVFKASTYVVSMRMYKRCEVDRVREVTRPYITTHGEPIAWGWDGASNLGIEDVNRVDWGDAPLTADGEPVTQMDPEAGEDAYVPVFWGCGVTPQEAVMRAQLPGLCFGHLPGHMIVLDIKEEDVIVKK